MIIYLTLEDLDDFLFNIKTFRTHLTTNNKKFRTLFDKITIKIVTLDDFTKTLTGKEMLKVVKTYEY